MQVYGSFYANIVLLVGMSVTLSRTQPKYFDCVVDVKNEEKVLGEIVTTVTPRWKMIGSHTARRTAISYWANQGKNMNWIRRFSGHKDMRSLQEYMLEEV